MRWTRCLTAVALVIAVLAGCTTEPEEAPPTAEPDQEAAIEPVPDDEPEPDPEPEQDTEPAEPGDLAVPDDLDDVDIPYVDAVMNLLLRVESEVLHAVLSRSSEIEDQELERLEAVLSGPTLDHTAERYAEYALGDEEEFAFVPLEEMGVLRWLTAEVRHAEPACLVVIGRYDNTEVAENPYRPDVFAMVTLSRRDDLGDPDDEAHNHSPWRLHDANTLRVGDQPLPPGQWEMVHHRQLLQTTCVEDAPDTDEGLDEEV